MKNILSLALTLAMLCSALGCIATPRFGDGGKVLNIYVWNDEFQTRFKEYFEKAGLVPADVKVNFIITPNQDNAYQNVLDAALQNQNSAAVDDKVDMFLVEADNALKYANSSASLDVYREVGLGQADTAQMYKYTKDLMTDSKGALKGVSWQACPGGLIYRRSIAKAVLGTDDPASVQKALETWDKFDAVAARAKAKGYFMVSGYYDDYRVFSDNMKSPWVDRQGKISIDPSIERWVSQTKIYTDKGYNNKAGLWSSESWAGVAKNGKVMCYFGPGWFIDFCLAPASKSDPKGPNAIGNGSFGDWAFCKGPQGFSWGGSWLCAAEGTDNISLVKSIMKKMACDQPTLALIAKEKGDFTNSVSTMTAIAKSDYRNDFLGGQNHIAFFLDSAQSIKRTNVSLYDSGMTLEFQKAFKDYFDGKISEAKALDNFNTAILERYPDLSK